METKMYKEMNTLEKFDHCMDWIGYQTGKLAQAVGSRNFDSICSEFNQLMKYLQKLEKEISDAERRMDYGERWDE